MAGVIHVRLTPRGGADRLDGWGEDPSGRKVLLARVRAAPIEGEANAALETLIAKALKVRVSAVSVERGGKSRLKAVTVEGLEPGEIAERLAAAL